MIMHGKMINGLKSKMKPCYQSTINLYVSIYSNKILAKSEIHVKSQFVQDLVLILFCRGLILNLEYKEMIKGSLMR